MSAKHIFCPGTKGVLPRMPAATIGVEFGMRNVVLSSGRTVRLQIWDTAGQERYRATTTSYYRNTVGALLVYDITRNNSFENVERWLDELHKGAMPEIVVALVGNKLDLIDAELSPREVSYDTAANFARLHQLLFFEASAVTAHNTTAVFAALVQEINDRLGEHKVVGSAVEHLRLSEAKSTGQCGSHCIC